MKKRPGENHVFITMERALVENMSTLVSEDVYDGEKCWVIPTILMAEGVHNGLFYSSEMFERFVGSWNGEPVTAGHPKGSDGGIVSANSPEVLEQCCLGWMFNVRVEDGKLKGDAWISKTRANSVCPLLVQMIQAGQQIEVSTGVFIEDDGEPGEWNGEKYTASVTGQSPDHLAFLPGGKGACSWEDGGGAPRVNEDKNMDLKERRSWYDRLRSIFMSNEPSHDDIRSMLRGALIGKLFPNGMSEEVPGPYVVDVFDKYVVYEAQDGDGYALYKQNYSVGADDSVELSGDSLKVRMKRDYVPVGNHAEPGKPAPNDAGANNKEDDMDRKEHVDTLIADNESRWGEESRDYLMGLKDEAFAKVTKEPEAPKPNETTEGEPKPAVKKDGEDKDEVDVNAAIEANPELKRAISRERKYKENLVMELEGNARCKFSKEALEAKDTDELETLADCLEVKVDYSGRSTGQRVDENEDDGKIDAPPSCNFDEKKED